MTTLIATPQVIQAIDENIAELTRLRDNLAALPPETFDGWRTSGGAIAIRLIQFHREWDCENHCRRHDADPRLLAKTIGEKWTRDGSDWQAKLIGEPEWRVVIHDAEPDRPPPQNVALD